MSYNNLTSFQECEIRDDEGRCGRVRLNDCDSVGQIKEKTLDSLYKGIGYSQRHREWEIELGGFFSRVKSFFFYKTKR